MRVKIGDTWYSSEDQPICLQVSETETKQIAENGGPNRKYLVAPEHIPPSDLLDWMSEPTDI